MLAYAFLVNNPKNEYESIIWLDRVSAALARCGCSP
jgi:D-alanyl-D-alanine carboxypeptidase/D-alanyl-D-alanine-endopeptidase (penicillin-binding protein 4)